MAGNGTDFKLRLSEDRMSALVDCVPGGVSADDLAVHIDQELATMGVVTGPARASLKGILESELGKGEGLSGLMIAGQAGSEAAVKTLFAPGNDYLLGDEVAWRRKKPRKCHDKARRVESQVRPLMAQMKLLSPAQREKTTELLAVTDFENTGNTLSGEADEMEAESRAKAVPRAVMNALLCQNSVFRIRRNELKIKGSYRGPLCAAREKQEVVLKPLEKERESVRDEEHKKRGS